MAKRSEWSLSYFFNGTWERRENTQRAIKTFAVGTLITVCGYMAFDLISDLSLESEFEEAASQSQFWGGDLSLVNDTVIKIDRAQNDHQIDMEARLVTVDSVYDAERIFTFKEYEENNPGKIAEIVTAACEIAQGTDGVIKKYDAQNPDGILTGEAKTALTRNDSFVQRYCNPVPEN